MNTTYPTLSTSYRNEEIFLKCVCVSFNGFILEIHCTLFDWPKKVKKNEVEDVYDDLIIRYFQDSSY